MFTPCYPFFFARAYGPMSLAGDNCPIWSLCSRIRVHASRLQSLTFSQTITNLPVSVFTTVKGGVGRQKAECEKMSDGNVGDDDASGLELLGWRK